MKTNKQIKLGAGLSYFTIFINIVSGLVYTPWMIRVIGNSNYGLYTLAMSLINTFTVDFGLSMAVQKYVSKYLAEKKQLEANRTVGIVFKLYLVITALMMLVFIFLFFAIEKIYPELSAGEVEMFKILYIIAAINCVITFPFIPIDGILHAYEKFVEQKICGFIHKMLTISLTVWALVRGMGVYSLVSANLISGIFFILLRLVVLRKKTPINLDFSSRDYGFLREVLVFSIWTSISPLAIRFVLSLQPSILGMVAGSEQIAIFGYAVSLEGYIYLFVNALNGLFLPTLTRMSSGNEKKENENVVALMSAVGRFILLLFGLMFIGFVAMGKEFITLLLGKEYVESYYCTILICLYGIIAYPQQIANTYIMVKDKVKKRALLSIVTLGVCLILSVVFGKTYGAIGVSIGICCALLLHTYLMNCLYKKDLSIDIGQFFRNCHLKMLPGMILYSFIAFLIAKIPFYGWSAFAIKVFVLVMVYAIIAWVLMLNKNEKNMVENVFAKIGIKKAN